jgi:hypothetical protein
MRMSVAPYSARTIRLPWQTKCSHIEVGEEILDCAPPRAWQEAGCSFERPARSSVVIAVRLRRLQESARRGPRRRQRAGGPGFVPERWRRRRGRCKLVTGKQRVPPQRSWGTHQGAPGPCECSQVGGGRGGRSGYPPPRVSAGSDHRPIAVRYPWPLSRKNIAQEGGVSLTDIGEPLQLRLFL